VKERWEGGWMNGGREVDSEGGRVEGGIGAGRMGVIL
jgi:hypothetical protein